MPRQGSRVQLTMRNDKGILLVEVVMAVAVLAVGLTLVSRSFTNSIRVLESSRDYTLAAFLAEEVLWELQAHPPDTLESEGTFEDHPNFKWKQDTIKDWDELELNDMSVSIEWGRRMGIYTITLLSSVPTIPAASDEQN